MKNSGRRPEEKSNIPDLTDLAMIRHIRLIIRTSVALCSMQQLEIRSNAASSPLGHDSRGVVKQMVDILPCKCLAAGQDI